MLDEKSGEREIVVGDEEKREEIWAMRKEKRGEIMEIRVFMCLISSLSFIFVGFECFYNGVFANITKFLFRNFPKFVLRKIVS